MAYTYEYRDGYYRVGGYVFKTEDAARNYCEKWNAYNAFMQPFFSIRELNRVEYETICAENGIEALPDNKCGFCNGDYKPTEYEIAICAKYFLAKLRQNAIESEKTQPVVKEQKMVLCDCGHYTTSPMSASFGTACPDCYDKMSD